MGIENRNPFGPGKQSRPSQRNGQNQDWDSQDNETGSDGIASGDRPGQGPRSGRQSVEIRAVDEASEDVEENAPQQPLRPSDGA